MTLNNENSFFYPFYGGDYSAFYIIKFINGSNPHDKNITRP